MKNSSSWDSPAEGPKEIEELFERINNNTSLYFKI